MVWCLPTWLPSGNIWRTHDWSHWNLFLSSWLLWVSGIYCVGRWICGSQGWWRDKSLPMESHLKIFAFRPSERACTSHWVAGKVSLWYIYVGNPGHSTHQTDWQSALSNSFSNPYSVWSLCTVWHLTAAPPYRQPTQVFPGAELFRSPTGILSGLLGKQAFV